MRIYRHGDVLIREVKVSKVKGKKVNSYVLAEGEVTGHTHTLKLNKDAQLFINKMNNELKFTVEKNSVTLTHQEHKPIEILPGTYVVIKENEFDYFEEQMKQVLD